ncbi:hypothetical protein NOR_01345 [Metarhizium rileyi]|uniref:Uncharacterized protein n=1 Tax=Metarhizium rileyi (strain RCEF 4871) TaxID=1649241 RepID=A0A167ITF6_METRR|nr:hypothetical protein NOR_01345 [Metarhizium rileyi RCEF 4871]TWU77986.1 hypothetical protein ED733_006038 [Metarhizium rileyi]
MQPGRHGDGPVVVANSPADETLNSCMGPEAWQRTGPANRDGGQASSWLGRSPPEMALFPATAKHAEHLGSNPVQRAPSAREDPGGPNGWLKLEGLESLVHEGLIRGGVEVPSSGQPTVVYTRPSLLVRLCVVAA